MSTHLGDAVTSLEIERRLGFEIILAQQEGQGAQGSPLPGPSNGITVSTA